MKNYRLLILLLLGLGFITSAVAQERLYIGKVSNVADNYRKQAAAAVNPSVIAKVAHSVPSKAPIELKLTTTKREGASESFYGEVANTKNSNFFLQISGGVVSGSIIMRDQKKYYRYSSTADGSVFLTEEDIDKILCVGNPQVDKSRVQEAPFVQPSSLTPDERKRMAPANAAGEHLGEIPFLQSLPGAAAVMYLDFDGQLVSGTPWNNNFNNGNDINAAPSTLSDAEMTAVWKIMAEDYRPFGINVTTSVSAFNAAAVNRRMRVIFTPTNYFYPGAGGVAYIGSFTWGGTATGETPCWVWNTGIKGAGEAGSHEGGHTLKLVHDGRTSPSEEYFYGQNNWAPIMGVGYNRSQVQWSKGEYPNASNTEDDLAKIITNGFGYRADDHGGTTSSATPLVRDAVGDVYAVKNQGVITTRFDADYFSFYHPGGLLTLNVNPDPDYPNLDIYAALLNSAGSFVTSSSPVTQSASINANVAAGNYYLVVDGTTGSLGANTDYASIGAYSISSPTAYCAPSYTTGCSSGDIINNFSFNTLVNNASGCGSGSTPGYTNYAPTGTRTTNVKPGNVYTLSMQAGASLSQGFGVWIDYNRDEDFNDAGEFVYASPSASTSAFSTAITIPAGASNGMTRMRVRSRWATTITSTQACTEFTWGETEDYTISISPYCIPIYTTGCGSGDYVYNFSFNTLVNNASGCSNGFTKGYTVYLPLGSLTTSVRRESTYQVKAQAGTFGQGFGVWIDYNKDKDFDDAGEFVYASPTSGTGLYTGNVTIPASAPLGTTRLRVRSKYNSVVTSSESCATFTWGEAEDYTISILGATTQAIQVNVFGGINPYLNPEWNNWNVSSSLSSGTLEYKSGETSLISAVLSKSNAVNDNGSGYGSGMAPAQVLRYTSNSTAARSLTFSGLSTSKYYSLELYASRNASSGQSTLFTIDGASQSIGTYINLTDKALYSNLQPGTDGKLEVLINNLNVYNYLNGFVLKESIDAPTNDPPTASAGSDKEITLPASSVVLNGSGSDPDGSVYKYTWSKLGGPSSFTFNSRTLTSPTVSNLVEGTYTFRLTVTDNEGATSYDDVQVVVAPGGAVTKLIKLNLFGGANPFADPEWNNWNVSGSLNSGLLNYSDGGASGVSAAISKHTLADNGAAYGGTMCPPEVLRYSSYATTTRTLTFSGLSTSKSYSLELYASRGNAGNSTKFTVNGNDVTILTDNNKTNKAVYSGLTPTASGTLVITIASVNTYNYLNGLILAESAAPPPPPTTKTWKVNLFGGDNPYTNAEWNNWNVSGSLNSGLLNYSDGGASGVSAAISKHTLADNGAAYGGTMCPPEVLRYSSYATTTRTLTFSGLSTSKSYSLELYASRGNAGNSTKFTVNGNDVTILTDNNKTNKAVYSGLTPTASGTLVITIASVNTYNYLNGLILAESAAPPPPPTTKTWKVNLFGGDNPYTNAEWNNWNVSGSLNSGALNYSDGGASGVSAAISKHTLADNGAAYGGTMCPPEVLRHASYATTTRTMTLSGLSTSKTYSLQLYASRANAGNSTTFTIGATSVTILTDNNKTSVASFTSLMPSSSGQIVLSIASVNTYNYLNGFILTEGTAPALLTGTGPGGSFSEEGAVAGQAPGARKGIFEQAVRGLQVRAYPNPSTAHFTFQVQSTEGGSVDLRIVDAVGRVVERKQNIAPNTTLTMGRGLKAGSYFLQAVQGTQTRSIKLLRKE